MKINKGKLAWYIFLRFLLISAAIYVKLHMEYFPLFTGIGSAYLFYKIFKNKQLKAKIKNSDNYRIIHIGGTILTGIVWLITIYIIFKYHA